MDIDELLKIAIEADASDLHLKAGNYPIIRIHGRLKPLTSFSRLTVKDTLEMADQITSDHQKEELRKNLDLDLAYSLPGFGRFRGSIYHQRGSIAIVLRIIPLEVKTISELNLPPVLEKISMEQRGLVLVTGTTGSGKTTTLAAMIDHVNSNRIENIITIEDPIEYLHRDKKSTISQREVGVDVVDFERGLRASLREDPDVILVGEMRDRETIETALLAAETGHLVLSTLHTLDAPETINRIVSVFAPHHQRQVRLQLASILKAVISMRLIPTKDGKGRVPAVEVMVNTSYIADCIQDREKTSLIRDAIAQGVSQYGMQTFDQSVYQLYKEGFISYEQGLRYSSSPDNFKLRVMGIRSTLDVALEDMERSMGKVIREEEVAEEEE
ncbi:MAG: type IV pili twitching motility protein PilT [Candidatus Aminicenantes bacterium 4484_214]|nr:MAG: type IV pili twitching motility protein PilT [Candidatus Aminicenantes bacterium 4484_214]RLE05543.1 MAG: type IV pili twitching motility protein PilT [Candidatus Aminicenantes bacterium]